MKTYIIAIILIKSVCLNASATDITTRVTELDRNKDGVPEVRCEEIYRGTNQVLYIMQSIKSEGVRTTARSYMVGGDILMIESDENGDGDYERLIFYHPTNGDIEAFSRQPDGSVKPVDAKVLDAYRKQDAAIADFWDKTTEKDVSDDELSDLMQKTGKKVMDSEK